MLFRAIFIFLVFCGPATLSWAQNSEYTQLDIKKIVINDRELNNVKYAVFAEDVKKTQAKFKTYQKNLRNPREVLSSSNSNFEFDSSNKLLIKFDMFNNIVNLEVDNMHVRVGESIEGFKNKYPEAYEKHQKYNCFLIPVFDRDVKTGNICIRYDESENFSSVHFYASLD